MVLKVSEKGFCYGNIRRGFVGFDASAVVLVKVANTWILVNVKSIYVKMLKNSRAC